MHVPLMKHKFVIFAHMSPVPPDIGTLPLEFALTGLPRSGTTYLSAVLHDPPRVICQSEARGAWKKAWADGANEDRIEAMVAEFRARIAAGHPVPTFEGTSGYRGGGRVDTWNQRKHDQVLDTNPDFRFGVKNPEIFLDWLPLLRSLGLPVIITLRHPVAIINSWLRKRSKRIAAGRPLGGTFGNGDATTFVASSEDPLDRCIELHEHLASAIIAHVNDPGVMTVHYADWFRDPDQLARIRGFLGLSGDGPPEPAPITPDPPEHLPPDGAERIRLGCISAEILGYDRSPSAWMESVR